MTIWEKVIVNLEKGAKKVSAGAAVFSERVRAEIAIARLRIRVDEVKSVLHEQYKVIGRRVVELKKKDELPRSTDKLIQEEEIVAALSEIALREKDLQDMYTEIANEEAAFTPGEKSTEDTIV